MEACVDDGGSMVGARICRRIDIPDPLRINRYRKSPELGPNILFFSGGTALNSFSKTLKQYTHNSIHLVTPFDSGGSSAELRKAFNMPAIGDLRSRLMALADESVLGHPEVYQLFNYRLPKDAPHSELQVELDALAHGESPKIKSIANPMRHLICEQLKAFLDEMPQSFDLRGASIGNLILAGGYLKCDHQIEPVVYLFSKLVNVLGDVRMIVEDRFHLGAELEDGRYVIGQHLLTGKEVEPLSSPVKRLFLSQSADEYIPVKAKISDHNAEQIKNAELICYSPGSYYSSILANLLPQGVGSAVAACESPKVYIPNLGNDPEQVGMTFEQSVRYLLTTLRSDAGEQCRDNRLLNFILIDSCNGFAPDDHSANLLREAGIEMIDLPLVSDKSAPYYDNDLLASALLSLV